MQMMLIIGGAFAFAIVSSATANEEISVAQRVRRGAKDREIITWSGTDVELYVNSSIGDDDDINFFGKAPKGYVPGHAGLNDDTDILAVSKTLGTISVDGGEKVLVEMAVESVATALFNLEDDDSSQSAMAQFKMEVKLYDLSHPQFAIGGLPGPMLLRLLKYDVVEADDYVQVSPQNTFFPPPPRHFLFCVSPHCCGFSTVSRVTRGSVIRVTCGCSGP
jgi:hypothetical protein